MTPTQRMKELRKSGYHVMFRDGTIYLYRRAGHTALRRSVDRGRWADEDSDSRGQIELRSYPTAERAQAYIAGLPDGLCGEIVQPS